MPTNPKDIALRLYEIFDGGLLDQLDEILDPAFSANVPGVEDVLDLAGYREFCRTIRQSFPDAQHDFEHVICEDDVVVTAGTLNATHHGDLGDLAATGRRISLEVVHVDTIVAGRVMKHLGVANMQSVQAQLSA